MGNTLQDLMYGFFKDPNAYSTQFLNGTGAPGALAARKGDYYLNNSNGDMYYYNGTAWSLKTNLNTATGITDHGLLSGLTDDDHPQYLNNTRGDARYATPDYVQGYSAQQALVGNLLTENQASGTDTLGTTAGFSVNASCTIASVTSPTIDEGRSLAVTATATTAMYVNVIGPNGTDNGYFDVNGGQSYTFQWTSMCPAGTRSALIRVYWQTSTGAAISNTAYSAGASATPVSTSVTFVAPVNARRALVLLQSSNGSVGDVVYFDRLGFWAGAGGDWAMPGIPITNLGTLVTHPNVDDVLVQRWDSSKATPGWQTIHYDSGVRSIPSLLTNPGATSECTLRRVGSTVFVRVAVTTFTSGVSIGALPVGFRPTYPLYLARTYGNLNNIIHNDGTMMLYGTSSLDRITATFDTTNAIPTSLPGTLASAAPA